MHNRRSIRLAGYDYSEEGAYFVTICTHNCEMLFGEIVDGEMNLSAFGKIAEYQWMRIPERFGNVELDEFVIMPNHVHGILILRDMDMDMDGDGHPQGVPVRAGLAPAPGLTPAPGLAPAPNWAPTRGAPTTAPRPKLGDIVGAYKSLVANECLKNFKSRNQVMGKLWHRNYYDPSRKGSSGAHKPRHIICNDKEYENIAAYIEFNPENWGEKDEYFR